LRVGLPRKRFVETFSHIATFVATSFEGDKSGGDSKRERLTDPELRRIFKARLRKHAANHVLVPPEDHLKRLRAGAKQAKHAAKAARKAAQGAAKEAVKEAKAEAVRAVTNAALGRGNTNVIAPLPADQPSHSHSHSHSAEESHGRNHYVEEDNYVSPMTVETYMEFRLRTLLDTYERKAPVLATYLRLIDMLTIIFLTSGTVLASMQLEVCVRRLSMRLGGVRLHDACCMLHRPGMGGVLDVPRQRDADRQGALPARAAPVGRQRRDPRLAQPAGKPVCPLAP
jgi:hypothetical protein